MKMSDKRKTAATSIFDDPRPPRKRVADAIDLMVCGIHGLQLGVSGECLASGLGWSDHMAVVGAILALGSARQGLIELADKFHANSAAPKKPRNRARKQRS